MSTFGPVHVQMTGSDPVEGSTETDAHAAWQRPPPLFCLDFAEEPRPATVFDPRREQHSAAWASLGTRLVYGSHHFHACLDPPGARLSLQETDPDRVNFRLDHHIAHAPGAEARIPRLRRTRHGIEACVPPDMAEQMVRLPGPVFFGSPMEPGNWGAWLLEGLPSAHEFVRRGQHGLYLCWCDTPWQNALLRFMGVNPSRVLPQEPWQTYHCDGLTLRQVSRANLVPTASDRALFRRIAERCGAAPGPERLYLGRRHLPQNSDRRRLVNEAELAAALSELGFVEAMPDQLAFADQVRLFRSARIVVGLGGAAMFNTVFSPPGHHRHQPGGWPGLHRGPRQPVRRPRPPLRLHPGPKIPRRDRPRPRRLVAQRPPHPPGPPQGRLVDRLQRVVPAENRPAPFGRSIDGTQIRRHVPAMCGRLRMATDYSEIKIRLRLDPYAPALNLRPSWNIPPTRDVVAVRLADGRRRAEAMRWGLIPSWAKDTKVGSTFNARADTLASKPTFRAAWRAGRRCLVVVDGFYEWRESDRQPYAVGMADGGLMTLGGLWQSWTSPEGEQLQTATVITTDANAAMSHFHHRMPVILTDAQWPAWLGEAAATEGELLDMLAPSDPDLITAWQIDKRVGNVRNDDPSLWEPVAEDVPRLI